MFSIRLAAVALAVFIATLAGCSDSVETTRISEISTAAETSGTDVTDSDAATDVDADADKADYEGWGDKADDGDWGDKHADQTADNAGIAPEGLVSATLEHGGLTRSYLVDLPGSYDESTPVPVVLNFHGFGGTAQAQAQVANFAAVADQENFIVVYPQGSALDDGNSHWNTAPPGGDNKSTADDFGFVAAVLDALSQTYAVDDSKVYATGYSNGGDMAYALACQMNDRIAAVAPMSGLMAIGEACDISHRTGLMSFNGTADMARPYAGIAGFMLGANEAAQLWAELNGIGGQPTLDLASSGSQPIERYSWSDDQGPAVIHYKVIDGGHIWFDSIEGGEPTSQTIWNFFEGFNP